MEKIREWVQGEEVELPQDFIVLAIPSATCEVYIEASVFADGELHKVHTTLEFNEVREAIKEAQNGYIPSDAIFQITPLGEKTLEELKARYRNDEDEQCI